MMPVVESMPMPARMLAASAPGCGVGRPGTAGVRESFGDGAMWVTGPRPSCSRVMLRPRATAQGSSMSARKSWTTAWAPAPAARTLLIPEKDVAQAMHQAASAAVPGGRLDISTLTPGDMIDGRYKYIERIGRGAFGTVLLMEDQVVDERLILKFLNPNVAEDEEVMKRFVHELRYSRKITHRNVIRIYDFLYIQGNYAISMEYFPSHTFGAEVVNEKPMPLKRAIQFGIDIATGMTVAHQVGIVHRDLKPANLLINEEGLLKIVDFGVAAAQREGDTQLTKTGYVIGSPKYMAPEQIQGSVASSVDIFALGVILHYLLTGKHPFAGQDWDELLFSQSRGPSPVSLRNHKIPADLCAICLKCLQFRPDQRYASAHELIPAAWPLVPASHPDRHMRVHDTSPLSQPLPRIGTTGWLDRRLGVAGVWRRQVPGGGLAFAGTHDAGYCGESNFTPSSCLFNGAQNSLVCRQ